MNSLNQKSSSSHNKYHGFWSGIGRLLYFVTWPGIWLVVKCTPPRTRVVIVHDGQVLVLRDWLGTGQWGLPGGGLHRGEDSRIGAVRETREETGIELNPEKLHPLGEFRMQSSGMTINYQAFYIELPKKPIVRVDGKEVVDYQWLNIDKLDKSNLSTSAKTIISTFYHKTDLLH